MRALRLLVAPPAALRFLRAGGTTHPASRVFRLSYRLRDAKAGRPGGLGAASPSALGFEGVETTRSPRFLGDPSCASALLWRPRSGQWRHGRLGATDTAPATTTAKAPALVTLSGLNRTASALASLRFACWVTPTCARVASGCRPALPGGLEYPQGHAERFQNATPSILLSQACPGAT